MLQRFLERVLFFVPGVHWIASRLREARELCCDEDALRHGGGERLAYARGPRGPGIAAERVAF